MQREKTIRVARAAKQLDCTYAIVQQIGAFIGDGAACKERERDLEALLHFHHLFMLMLTLRTFINLYVRILS